ncbi:MAG: 50S ribosomal protein L10 [Planctomycetaceae bacterium]|nr:50S ribosomal protein L10 [Planctomycetaceae bacterium]
MSKPIKQMIIDDIRQKLGECRDVLGVNSSKLDAITDNRVRGTLRAKGIHLLQVKNTLARRALEEVGVKSMETVLAGPSTLVWGGEDIVSLSKEIAKWAKEIDKLEIKGGAVEGQVVDAKGVVELSKSPGRLELISQIVGLALSPGARLAGALLGPGGTISGQLKAMADKDEDASAAA